MPDFPSGPLLQKPATRESATLPDGWGALDAQRDQWQSFADLVVHRDSFWQLVVILAHSIVTTSIHWNTTLLQNIISPDHPQQDERFTALVTLQKIARSPPSTPITNLPLTGEQLQGFMRPILPTDHVVLQPAWLNGQLSLGSTPITRIATVLQKLGCPLDLGMLVARRRQLLAVLSHHQIQAGPTKHPLIIPWLREYSRLRNEVLTELGKSVHEPFMETIIDVVVLSRSENFTGFLYDWSLSLEAEVVIAQIHAAVHREPSHNDQVLAHRETLLLLVAAFSIQCLFFGNGVETDQGRYLPSYLSEDAPSLYRNATLSYAQYYRQEPTLSVFSPSLYSKREDTHGIALWKGYWNQQCPSNWSPYAEPEVKVMPRKEIATRQPCMGEVKSHFDNDSHLSGRLSVLKLITECFRKRS